MNAAKIAFLALCFWFIFSAEAKKFYEELPKLDLARMFRLQYAFFFGALLLLLSAATCAVRGNH